MRRQRARQPADLQRAVERHCAAETQLEAQLDEGRSLLRTAVEGMGDAPVAGMAAQVFQQRIGRAAHVQQHRQIVPPCQRQLLGVEMLLPFARQAGDEVVDTDLADRHQPRVVALALQFGVEPGQVAIVGPVDTQRMNAQCIDQTVAVGQLAHRRQVVHIDRRQHDLLHAGRRRTRHHLRTIGVELAGIQMAMRVDPHARIMHRPPAMPAQDDGNPRP